MRTLIADHPLVTHKLTLLRDARTDTATFRARAYEQVSLLSYQATREIPVAAAEVTACSASFSEEFCPNGFVLRGQRTMTP